MATSQNDVLWLLDVIASLETDPVIAGGWGIDALTGRQTRPHRDLDVLIPDPFVDALVEALTARSFSITTDWLPARMELTDGASDRRIDIHPAFANGQHGWWQNGFDDERFESTQEVLTDGMIGGRKVRCFTAAKQLELHQGYPPSPQDLLDIAVLHQLDDDRAMLRYLLEQGD